LNTLPIDNLTSVLLKVITAFVIKNFSVWFSFFCHPFLISIMCKLVIVVYNFSVHSSSAVCFVMQCDGKPTSSYPDWWRYMFGDRRER